MTAVKSPRTDRPDKGMRALELREQGLTLSQIAERLGSSPKSIVGIIAGAKKRRDSIQSTTERSALGLRSSFYGEG